LAFDILEHISYDEMHEFISSIYSLLKPGGILIAQSPNAMSPLSPFLFADYTHRSFFTPSSMNQVLLSGGFTHVELHSSLILVHGIISMFRRLLWIIFTLPIIKMFMLLVHGSFYEGIYTANFLAIAHKDQG